MADVEAFVWHDLAGNITAVGHVVSSGEGKVIEPQAADGRKVLKVMIAQEHLATLHLTHAVNIDDGRLTLRDR
jgi:hypothetical protein